MVVSMEEAPSLTACCRHIADTLYPAPDDMDPAVMNEVVPRLPSFDISLQTPSAIEVSNSVIAALPNILNGYGSCFYNESEFRRMSRAYLLSIGGSQDPTSAWYHLRALLWLSLLNPFTSEDTVEKIPDVSLSLLVEFMDPKHQEDRLLLEWLTLLWRLRNDIRLGRKARQSLVSVMKSKETGAILSYVLEACLSLPNQVFHYKLRLFSFLSDAFKLQRSLNEVHVAFTNAHASLARRAGQEHSEFTEEQCSFSDLHVLVPVIASDKLLCKNLIQIGDRVSYLRYPDAIYNEGFVDLDYTSDVLSTMLCHIDCSLGSVVSGENCKEFYIRELANRAGMPSKMISRIYTDERMDVKTLIGQWMCTEKVGEFQFNYGVLTTAMIQGRWIIFEESLTESIACLIHSICQQGHVTISELNETIQASSNFHIFITTSQATFLRESLKDLPITKIPDLSEEDCMKIISKRYPLIGPIRKMVISGFFMLRDKLKDHRAYNVSDLFKIANRLNTSGAKFEGYLSSSVKGIILEAFYCIVIAGIPGSEARITILGELGKHFGFSGTSCYDMLPLNQIKASEHTRVHVKVLHQLMSCYLCNEPVLLVGETGSGKTAIVQHFAKITGNTLKVYVFSEQSEAEDLIGSFYPDNISDICATLLERAIKVLLCCCVVDYAFTRLLDELVEYTSKGLYKNFFFTLAAALEQISIPVSSAIYNEIQDQRKECILRCGPALQPKIGIKLGMLQKPLKNIPDASLQILEKYMGLMKSCSRELQFKFEEGLLIQAMREGYWILLDEINLAPSDLLQRFLGILSRAVNTFELYECGNRVIDIHENFRVFACMNPPTIKHGNVLTYSTGKKALPLNFRNRMTEIFVDAVDTIEDISIVVSAYIGADDHSLPSETISHFYHDVIQLCRSGALEDCSSKPPTFTLRNLVRTINYMHNVMKRHHKPIKDPVEAFVEGALSCFASSLDPVSSAKVEAMLPSIPDRQSSVYEETLEYIRVETYWIRKGDLPFSRQESYIVTPNIQKNIRRISRMLSGLRAPVLLEGPTACGKTSLVQFLSELTGHKCVRINNHEHTDLSEYLGQFVFDSVSNQLKFNYGPIVTAMREGHWVILDELNLAPSQVLEALNRILDDNREIYIPETGETIQSHKEFMIFATQNPANSIYGGRKQLSKAFCNRFVQLYIDGLDNTDLQQVLTQRCKIPLSRSMKIVSTYVGMQTCPLTSMTFDRHSVLITLRDLIKWANRVQNDDEGLPYYGWCIIAEKLRDPGDKEKVKEIIERCCLLNRPLKDKVLHVDFSLDNSLRSFLDFTNFDKPDARSSAPYLWIEGMSSRLVALLLRALENREPVLLIGETGIGKTTICQVLAKYHKTRLNIMNLSKNTEASDFIGSFRPIRAVKQFHTNVGTLIEYFEGDPRYNELIEYLKEVMRLPMSQVDKKKFLDIMELVSTLLRSDIKYCIEQPLSKRPKNKDLDISHIETVVSHLVKSFSGALFEWVDGPLTRSMEQGDWFLADEISLADDAVLEKMNSVLEFPSSLTIPEAGGETLRVIKGHDNFRLLATMNPGGDHGKRELSPALLNRFTVIYIPTPEFDTYESLKSVMDYYSPRSPEWLVRSMAEVIHLHNTQYPQQKITLRDVIKWSQLIVPSSLLQSFLHGAHVIFLDSVIPGTGGVAIEDILDIIAQYNPDVDPHELLEHYDENTWLHYGLSKLQKEPTYHGERYNFTSKNCLNMVAKVMRALEVNRPILLEGAPGVGKTASISAIAAMYGVKLLRVNLSEHTDIMDLFGSDLPTVSDGTWKFVWHNGPVIEAAVNGHWIVLDELNLASQQVLEGLNALLDHRRETFIPELDRFIKCHEKFRLFASQNSATDGGGRKHLPKSFLNRFTKIYCLPLEREDYCEILCHLYGNLTPSTVGTLVDILFDLKSMSYDNAWDWNLRDCMRFCEALSQSVPSSRFEDVFKFTFMSRISSREQSEYMIRALGAAGYKAEIPGFIPFKWDASLTIDVVMDMDHTEETKIQEESKGTSDAIPGLSASESIWMHSHEEAQNVVTMAAYMNFPILLVGPTSTGKKSLLKCVANTCGQPLAELTMLPCLDIGDLLGGFEQVAVVENGNKKRAFRWVDSLVISAIEKGNWLLLTKIHNANPAILDRLNPLLETGGTITLNESGDCNRVVKPHPNFRIFMTADSKYVGRLSRAFRNRCLEVNIGFPNALYYNHSDIPKCVFMERICETIWGMLSNALDIMQEDYTELSFKCATLLDGARLVRSIRKYSCRDSLTISLCNCVLGWYITQRSCGGYCHCDWLFLKRWCMLDQPLHLAASHIAAMFPRDMQAEVCKIVNCCLQWCFDNLTRYEDTNDLSKIAYVLENCKLFNDRFKRDLTVSGIHRDVLDADAALWFVFRGPGAESEERCRLLFNKQELKVPSTLASSLINLTQGMIAESHENQALFDFVVFDGMASHENFSTTEFRTQFMDKLIKDTVSGKNVAEAISQLQFVSFLISLKSYSAPLTVEYISQRTYSTMISYMFPEGIQISDEISVLNIPPNDCFNDYSTEPIGEAICSGPQLALELQKNGIAFLAPLGNTAPSTSTITMIYVKEFVESLLDVTGHSEAIGKMSPSEVILSVPTVESPSAGMTKFLYDSMKFLGYWVCHQFLVGEMNPGSLTKVYDYSLKLLQFHVEMQKDLPGSSLAAITSVQVALRKLISNPTDSCLVYQIMLDTWSLHNELEQEVELDLLEYMVYIFNGRELASADKVNDKTVTPRCPLNNITSVMLFWNNVSSENGIATLQDNIKRVASFRQMLNEHISTPQWSALFTTLTFISPILSKALNVEASWIESIVHAQYSAIINDDVKEIDANVEDDIYQDGEHESFAAQAGDNTRTVRFLACRIIRNLENISSTPLEKRTTLVDELWLMCGLLLLMSMPNTTRLIEDVTDELKREHRSYLKVKLEHRLENYVTLDTLSDGECREAYIPLKDQISVLVDYVNPAPSLRSYTSKDSSSENIGSRDVIAMLKSLQGDINTFCEQTLLLREGNLSAVRYDIPCLVNFRKYLLRKYALLPEVVRTIVMGIDCLSFISAVRPTSQQETLTRPKEEQLKRISLQCLRYPFNILKQVPKKELLFLSARVYDTKGLYDICCYIKSLLSSVGQGLLTPPSMEPLKYAVLLLSGICSKLKTDKEESQEMRMSLLQACIVEAQKNTDKSVHDLLPSQQEIVRAIVRDCGPIDEYEPLAEDESIEEPEQNRQLRRITLLCKMLTVSLGCKRYDHVAPMGDTAGASCLKEDNASTASTGSYHITEKMIAALCLSIACSDAPKIQQEESIIFARGLMKASEEYFGYKPPTTARNIQSFYREVDIPSCSTAWSILTRMKAAVAELLAQFEGQQQLLEIQSMLSSISKVKLPTLTQVLLVTLLETLAARVQKWNSIAHSGVSLSEHTSELEKCVLQLRHTEMKGWYNAIDERLEAFRQESYSCLVHFMEMCSSMHDASVAMSTRISNCATEIVNFSMSAPIAHFEPIIHMLNAVCTLYRDSTVLSEVSMRHVLENIVTFLELWKPSISSRLEALKQEARKEVNELVKRVNWSGPDYTAISTLVKKQRIALASTLRRFQEAVAQPCYTVYATTPVTWWQDKAATKVIETTTPKDQHIAEEDGLNSSLLECISSNMEYIRENQSKISRVQITRITTEIGSLLQDCGYRAATGNDVTNWLDWIDLSQEMSTHGCAAAEAAKDAIMRCLHIICDLKEFFKRNKEMGEFFNRNVDMDLFGYLVTMLREVQHNLSEDVASYQRYMEGSLMSSIVTKGPTHQMGSDVFQLCLSTVDDIYEGALQATSAKVDPKGGNTSSDTSVVIPDEGERNPLLSKVSSFRTYLINTEEFRTYSISKSHKDNILISERWLKSVEAFCRDVAALSYHAAPVSQFFLEQSRVLKDLISKSERTMEANTSDVTGFISTNVELPQACLYMAQLIDSIAHVEPPQEECEQDSKEEWAAGTGLEDGTGAKNVSDEVDPEDGMFDNFKNDHTQEAGNLSQEKPSLDVYMEFDGEVMEVDEPKELSDIEEEENPGKNEGFEDLQKQQLDTDLVDQEPPLERKDDNLDIEGVPMDDSDVTHDKGAEEKQSSENSHTAELEQDHQDNKPENDKDDNELNGKDDLGKDDSKDGSNEEATKDDADVPEGDIEDLMEGLGPQEGDEMDAEESADGEEDGTHEDTNEGDQDTTEEDEMQVDNIQEEPMNDATEEPNDANQDLANLQGPNRKEYDETPYGTEQRGGSNIKQEDGAQVGGNSYEEDQNTGSYYGNNATSHNRSGMTNFLDMIQRLEKGLQSSKQEELRMRNITGSLTGGRNNNESESSQHEMDDNSNMEGLSASMEGSAIPNVDIDMAMVWNEYQKRPLEILSEGVDPKGNFGDQNNVMADDHQEQETEDPCDLKSTEDVDASTVEMDTSALMTSDVTGDLDNRDLPTLPSIKGSTDNTATTEYMKIWRQYRDETSAMSTRLSEQMRMVLEPTKSAGLQGDYKTGKRISIRKLMAFIASNFQRDKIWLRRCKPSKRDYRVVLAIDNSKSMSVTNAGTLALKSFACIYQAMSVLEVGKLSVCKFGGNVPEIVLEMDGGEDPSRVVAGMTFDEESRHSYETGIPELLKYVLQHLNKEKGCRKIVVIISDGKFNKDKARPWVHEAVNNEIVPLLVVLDPVIEGGKSITQMRHVREINGTMTLESYLTNFPFQYYAVIQNLEKLPSILSELLRQWFALSSQS